MLKVLVITLFVLSAHSEVHLSKKALEKKLSFQAGQNIDYSLLGSADGGGVDFEVMMGKDSWFTQKRDGAPETVRYCIEMNLQKTNMDENKVDEVFQKILGQWFNYIRDHKIEAVFKEVPIYVKNYDS